MGKEQKPRQGMICREFRDGVCQVLLLARAYNTGTELVIYQMMEKDFAIYAMPLEQFMVRMGAGKVAPQRPGAIPRQEASDGNQDAGEVAARQTGTLRRQEASDGNQGAGEVAAQQTGTPIRQETSVVSQEESDEAAAINPRLIQFLDATTYGEKMEILSVMRNTMDEKTLLDIAAALDMAVPEGDMAGGYEALMDYLKMHKKYECSRFR